VARQRRLRHLTLTPARQAQRQARRPQTHAARMIPARPAQVMAVRSAPRRRLRARRHRNRRQTRRQRPQLQGASRLPNRRSWLLTAARSAVPSRAAGCGRRRRRRGGRRPSGATCAAGRGKTAPAPQRRGCLPRGGKGGRSRVQGGARRRRRRVRAEMDDLTRPACFACVGTCRDEELLGELRLICPCAGQCLTEYGLAGVFRI